MKYSEREWVTFTPEQKQLAHNVDVFKAQNKLERLMGEAALLPVHRENIRKLFPGTNIAAAKYAIKIEKQIQEKETDEYHREHAAEYLAAAGIKLEDLPTGERVQ